MDGLVTFPHTFAVEAVYLGNGPGGSPSFLIKGAAGSFEAKVTDGVPVGLGVGQPVVLGYSTEYIPQKRTSFGIQLARVGVVLQFVKVSESSSSGQASPNGNGAMAGTGGGGKPAEASKAVVK